MQSSMATCKQAKRVLNALLISLVCTMPASAQIYRCTVDGRTVVQDRQCDARAKQEVRTLRGGASSFEGCYQVRYEGLAPGTGIDGDIRIFRDGPRWFMSRLDAEGRPNADKYPLRESEPRDFEKITRFSSITRLHGMSTSSALVSVPAAAEFTLFRSGGTLCTTRGPWFGFANRINCPKAAVGATRRPRL